MATEYDLDDFNRDFPEFEKTADLDKEAALARAKSYVVESVWGEHYCEGVGLKTAVLLESHLYGHRTRPAGVTKSRHELRFEELECTIPRRILGIF